MVPLFVNARHVSRRAAAHVFDAIPAWPVVRKPGSIILSRRGPRASVTRAFFPGVGAASRLNRLMIEQALDRADRFYHAEPYRLTGGKAESW